jgi:5-methylcytosine-specific restriction endonuclease McrA
VLKPCSIWGDLSRGSRRAKHPLTRPTTTEPGLGSQWQRIARDQVKREPWCSYTGCTLDQGPCNETQDLTADHIAPRAVGGSHVDGISTLCRRCNSVVMGKNGPLEGSTFGHPRGRPGQKSTPERMPEPTPTIPNADARTECTPGRVEGLRHQHAVCGDRKRPKGDTPFGMPSRQATIRMQLTLANLETGQCQGSVGHRSVAHSALT